MPLGAMEERSNWTGRLEEGKRKGNEKDQGKTSPKSIAWAVSKTKDGWRQCHCSADVLVRPHLLRTAVARSDEITSSRGRAVGFLLPFERAASRRHATVGRAGRLSRLEIAGLPRPA